MNEKLRLQDIMDMPLNGFVQAIAMCNPYRDKFYKAFGEDMLMRDVLENLPRLEPYITATLIGLHEDFLTKLAYYVKSRRDHAYNHLGWMLVNVKYDPTVFLFTRAEANRMRMAIDMRLEDDVDFIGLESRNVLGLEGVEYGAMTNEQRDKFNIVYVLLIMRRPGWTFHNALTLAHEIVARTRGITYRKQIRSYLELVRYILICAEEMERTWSSEQYQNPK